MQIPGSLSGGSSRHASEAQSGLCSGALPTSSSVQTCLLSPPGHSLRCAFQQTKLAFSCPRESLYHHLNPPLPAPLPSPPVTDPAYRGSTERERERQAVPEPSSWLQPAGQLSRLVQAVTDVCGLDRSLDSSRFSRFLLSQRGLSLQLWGGGTGFNCFSALCECVCACV